MENFKVSLNKIYIPHHNNLACLILPFTIVITGSDMMANPSVEALQMYEPLSDCCIGLNCR
jgi:hypothetical protein